MRRDRHAFLRQATKAAHEDLERAVASAGFFDAAGAYGDYLRRLRLFHSTVHKCFGAAGLDGLRRWHVKDHATWLDEDITALGLGSLPEEAASLFRKPIYETAAARLGALYVLLGSGRGARVLVKRVEALGLPGAKGRTYLTQLSRTSDWPGFLDVLEKAPLSGEAPLASGAVATFESVLDHMSGALAA
jgi:heme oxygenase